MGRRGDQCKAPRVAEGGTNQPHATSTTVVLVIGDTGDCKDRRATDHIARQYLGSAGKIDNGMVVDTSLWTDGQHCHPVHVMSYTSTTRLVDSKRVRRLAPSH